MALGIGEQEAGRRLELHDGLSDGGGEGFARPNAPGHPGPAPRVDLGAHGYECFGIGVGGDTGLIAVAVILASYQVLAIEGTHGP